MTLAQKDRDRFWKKVRLRQHGCWEWQASVRKDGYGRFAINSKPELSHRIAYYLVSGPMPRELEIDHLCRNRLCVNPSHMELVSKRVNILRGECHAANNKRKTHCKSGHELTELNIYTVSLPKRKCKFCARARSARKYEKMKNG